MTISLHADNQILAFTYASEHHRADVRGLALRLPRRIALGYLWPRTTSRSRLRPQRALRPQRKTTATQRDNRDRAHYRVNRRYARDRMRGHAISHVLDHALHISRPVSRREVAARVTGQARSQCALDFGARLARLCVTALQDCGTSSQVEAGIKCVLHAHAIARPVRPVHLCEAHAVIPS